MKRRKRKARTFNGLTIAIELRCNLQFTKTEIENNIINIKMTLFYVTFTVNL